MKPGNPNITELPLNMTGASNYGRYPKISTEKSFNFVKSDSFAVPYPGWRKVLDIEQSGQGRGIATASSSLNKMIAVINNDVYAIDSGIVQSKVGELATSTGDVFIAENNARQIAICDKKNIYIYDYGLGTFQTLTLDFTPGYIAFQDGYFISVDLITPQWRLSDFNNGVLWPFDASHVGQFQTKADQLVAVIRVPGKGNLIYLFGNNIVEQWYDTGVPTNLFPYQKNTYQNIDYGSINPATIAATQDFVVWLGRNEREGPVIMISTGGAPQTLSTDGINFQIGMLKHPEDSYAFMFKSSGHLIYQITWPTDNLTLYYDFETKEFRNACDPNQNFHPAKRVAFFNNTYYFVSFNDGNLYQMSDAFTNADGITIPRIRVTGNLRLPDTSRFIVRYVTFTMEQGEPEDNLTPNNPPVVQLAISTNGGATYSSYVSAPVNPVGQRRNQIIFRNLGMANEMVFQFRFYGTGRFVFTDGVVGIEQFSAEVKAA